jgi:hypothetical protein
MEAGKGNTPRDEEAPPNRRQDFSQFDPQLESFRGFVTTTHDVHLLQQKVPDQGT